MGGQSRWAALILGTTLCGPVAADDTLPPPQPVIEAPPSYFVGTPIYRRSAYEVWQNYGVDRQGFFRPLVVNSPYGAYYRYNGAPFPWTTTHQREFMPYVVD
jgi:hypothetical protein